MENTNSPGFTNLIERDSKDFTLRGDDFFKIELLRQAKCWYTKALKLTPEKEELKLRIAECNRLLAFENKVVAILGGVAVVLAIVLSVINL